MDGYERKNWLKRHKILTIVGIIVIIIIAATASSANKTNVNTTATNNSVASKSSASQTPPAKSNTATTAHVGSTVNIGGSKGLAVTLQKVIDPATGSDQYMTADAGKRFVAVEVAIQNNGSAAYNDDANSNVSLIGSDNQTYTADFDSVSECTNFNDGEYTLAVGENTTGCVTFQVPNGVNTAKIQFQAVEGLSNSTGEWLVP